MKTLLLTLGLISLTTLSHAQGTIAFGNSALTRIIACYDNPRPVTSADNVRISVWFGPAGSEQDALVQVPGTATIGATAGVMIGAPSVFALPGTEPNQVVSLQIRAEGGLGSYQTKVAQVTLGQTAGPGTVIWQTASGTNPNRFTPLVLCVPEPSTIALGALGGLALLFRLRKSSKPTDS